MKSANVGGDNLEATKRAHPNINWRYLLNQTNKASGMDELTFNAEILGGLIDGGKEDAKKAVQAHMVAQAASHFLQ